MQRLNRISEDVRQDFEAQTAARDAALAQTRQLTRHCAMAIRAIHRNEKDNATAELEAAGKLAGELRDGLKDFPDLYYAGYTQDALKEFAEAHIVDALVSGRDLPSPQDLNLISSTYMKGLAEAAGELRRRCLDILRHGHSEEAERLLGQMDDIYAVLVTMDYPDAVTDGLRRLTDLCRGIVERTRGDMTISLRQKRLEQSLQSLEDKLSDGKK